MFFKSHVTTKGTVLGAAPFLLGGIITHAY
jgi:hypothetical protein